MFQRSIPCPPATSAKSNGKMFSSYTEVFILLTPSEPSLPRTGPVLLQLAISAGFLRGGLGEKPTPVTSCYC